MGLRDFIENMRYGGWKYHLQEFHAHNTKYARELRGHVDELEELVTVGAFEMKLKGNSDYKTSAEKNREAAERVSQIEELLATAELRMQGQCEELEAKVYAHYKFIHSLTLGSLSTWQSMATNWGQVAQDEFIEKQCLSLHVLSAVPELTLSSLRRRSEHALTLTAPHERSGESMYSRLMPLAIQMHARIKAANENVRQSEVFGHQVSERLVALEMVETQITGVQHRLEESRKLLSGYDKHLQTVLGRLRARSNRGLTGKEVDLAGVASVLASTLVALSSDAILDPSDDSLDSQSTLRNDLRQVDQLIARFV